VTPTVTTNYTVTGGNGICSNTKTTSVNVNSLPIVTATSATICAGQTATLTAGGATSYTWNTSATTTVIAVTPTVTTNYTVTGGNGICSNTKTTSVNVNALPVVSYAQNPTMVCVASTSITLSAATPTGGGYSGTTVTGNIFDPSTAGTGTFVITYLYTDGNSCSNSAFQNIIVSSCTGFDQLVSNDQSVSIYPNPSNGLFTIKSKDNNNALIEVINMLGQIVYQEKNLNENQTLDLYHLQNGLYTVKVSENGKTISNNKIIIQK
ncbi:T9SS type A sorting domain-containing protein, partial [Ferruginibacter sp.]|uniref:T9SS type A sorting domain-containing protein n=1 Tax=Ferruginibacter sp. TaxID=1940288 RepID=UPI0019B315D5